MRVGIGEQDGYTRTPIDTLIGGSLNIERTVLKNPGRIRS